MVRDQFEFALRHVDKSPLSGEQRLSIDLQLPIPQLA